MKILHYALGLPPYRTGGLTEYVYDLSLAQISRGHEVTVLWPGRRKLFSTGHISVYGKMLKNGIFSAEMTNPLPVPLLNGVGDPSAYMEARDSEDCARILEALKPDVLHVHTLMGLPKELIDEAEKLGIPMVFTTHDYYPLCPVVNMYRGGSVCDVAGCTDGDCANCSRYALSDKKIYILQHPLYRALKDSAPVKKVRKKYKAERAEQSVSYNGATRSENPGNTMENSGNDADTRVMSTDEASREYGKLRAFYLAMLKKMRIHANSSLAGDVYHKFLPDADIRVLPITHGHVRDRRVERNLDGDLRIAFSAACESYKGFPMLLEALDALYEERQDFKLHVYKGVNLERPYLLKHDSYSIETIEETFADMHVMVVPSLWQETFGFTVPEALSLGIVPLVSENVGAKDLVKNGENGFVLPLTAEAWTDCIRKLLSDKELYGRLNRNIMAEEFTLSMDEHEKETEQLYR